MTAQPAYLVDTDALIWHLRKRSKTVEPLSMLANDGPLACSALTVSEILWLAREHELKRTNDLVDSLVILPVSAEVAKLAAQLMRQHGPGYVDCHIAATALLEQIPLVTYNQKDFERTGAPLFDVSEW